METQEYVIYTIKKAMKEKKVTHSDLGNLLSLRRDTVNKKLNGFGKLYFEEIIKICDYLGLEITITKKGQSNE